MKEPHGRAGEIRHAIGVATGYLGRPLVEYAMYRFPLARPLGAVALLAACTPDDTGLTVNNEEPVARITSHQDGDVALEGRDVALVGAVSDEDDATADLIATWQVGGVDLCPPAAPEADGATRCTAQFPPGETSVSLLVRDADDAVGQARVALTIQATDAPTVAIESPAAGTPSLYANLPIRLQGSVGDKEDPVEALTVVWSSDRDGDLTVPQPDGSGNTGGETLLSAGDHLLTLAATDRDGKEGKAVVRVTVKPDHQPPTCSITAPPDGGSSEKGEEVLFTAEASDADIPAEQLVARWVSDRDGLLSEGPVTSLGTTEVKAKALSEGTHRITLTVTDEIGVTCIDDTLWTIGLPPRVTVIRPSDGDRANEGVGVAFEATVADADHPPSALEVVWRSDRDGVLATLKPDSSGASGFTTSGLSRGVHALTVRATDGDGLYHEVRRTLTINGLPGAPKVSLKPDPATTIDPLSVSVDTAAVDPDGDPVTYTYAWSRDGIPSSASTTDTLPSSATRKGEAWRVEVTPTDGWGSGPSASATITIQNSAPTLTSASVSPSSPKTGDDLTCTASGAGDPDGDPVSIRWSWTIDGKASPTITGVLPASETKKGDRVVCTATPFDGTLTGTPVVAPSIFVQNSAPSVASASIGPAGATAADPLTCAWTGFTDADGDSDSSTVSWKVGGKVIGSGKTLSSGYKKGETVTCEVTPFDGTDSGTVVSASIVVKNAAPSVKTALITPTSPDATDPLTCSWSGFADADGDSDASTVQWKIAGKVVGTSTSLAAGTAKKGETVTCEVTPFDGVDKGTVVSVAEKLVNAPPSISAVAVTPASPTASDTLECSWTGYTDPDGDPDKSTVSWKRGTTVLGSGTTLKGSFKKGDSITCEVTPADGVDVGVALTRSVTITNAKPEITAASLSPSPAYTGDTLAASATTTDVDGDTVTLKYVWKVNGKVTGSSSSTLDGKLYFSKNDDVEAEITPNDGTDDGFTFVRSVTISNSLPTLTGISLSPSSPTVLDTATCAAVGFADADGDSDKTRYSWHVGKSSSPAIATGATLALSGRKKGEVLVCVTTPNDGTSDGTARETSVTVANAPPTVTSVALSPSTPTRAASITASVVATDPDADSLTYSYAWDVNGTTVSATGSSLPTSFFKRGDVVSVSVTADDGTAKSKAVTSASVTVANAKPSVGSVVIDKTKPTVADTITCSYSGYSDLDGDGDKSTIAWKKGSSTVGTSATLSLRSFAKGDVLTCEVTPNDGTDTGAPVASSVTVQNATPVMTSVSLSPGKVYTNTEVTATPASTDLDGDTITYIYTWYVNGIKVGETSQYLDGAVYFNRLQTIYVEVAPFDGTATGTALKSSTISVLNTPPFISGIILTGVARVGATLDCEVVGYSDDDGDSDFTTIEWDVNGTVVGTGRTLKGGFKKGDKITCTAVPYDGYDKGTAVSVTTTGVNTAPVLSSITLGPSPLYTNTDARVTGYVASDADGDTLTVTGYSWDVNSAYTGVTASTLPESNFKKGDKVAVSLTISDGTATATLKSGSVTVANSPPSEPTVVFKPAVWFDGLTDDTYRRLVCAPSPAVTDADGDTITLSYAWKVNGKSATVPKPDEMDAVSFGDEDEVECTITASDGTATTSATELMDIFDDPVDWAGHWGPCSATGKTGGTLSVEAWVYDTKRTPAKGAGTDLTVQAGIGPSGSDPAKEPGKWTWTTATWFAERPGLSTSTDNDAYKATLTLPGTGGTYDVLWRVTTDGGLYYTYADLYEETNRTYANGCKGAGSTDGYTSPMPVTVSP